MSIKPQNTKRTVHVRPVQKDDYVVWDEMLSQLGRRVRKTRETWIVQTRVDSKTKRRTLGACGEIKIEAARVLAQAYLGEMAKPGTVAHADTTLAEFAERFLEDCSGQWKPTTLSMGGKCLNGSRTQRANPGHGLQSGGLFILGNVLSQRLFKIRDFPRQQRYLVKIQLADRQNHLG